MVTEAHKSTPDDEVSVTKVDYTPTPRIDASIIEPAVEPLDGDTLKMVGVKVIPPVVS